MSLIVQGDEAPGQRTTLTAFRLGLRSYAEANLDRTRDRIMLVEPNVAWHEALSELWSGWPNAEIVTGTVRPSGLFYRADDDTSTVLSPDPRFVRTHLPNAAIHPIEVAVLDLRDLASGAFLVSLDARTEAGCVDQPWADIDAERVVVELPGYPSPTPTAVRRALADAGYTRAGRAWGEAGSGSLWQRADRPVELVTAVASEARVRAGAGIVAARRLLPIGPRGAALRTRARALASREVTSADVFDPGFGMVHEPLDRDYVRHGLDSWIAAASLHPDRTWALSGAREREPEDVAAECRARLGVLPISFSYPGAAYPLQSSRLDLISPIIPGFPYSFSDPDEYMRTYGSAALAVTHRKAGWDCFRHVEIMAAGSVPLMVDIEQLPPYSMVHYPRKAMSDIVRRMRSTRGAPDPSVAEQIRAHFSTHLSSSAMAHFVLRHSGLIDAERILFVDSQHPFISDYQSTLALIGIKQVLGSRIEPLYPTPWIYADYADSTMSLYGRGFGYTRTVDPAARTAAEAATITGETLAGLDLSTLDVSAYDAVVIGSVSRNVALAEQLLDRVAPERTVWLHTEDTPPLPSAVRWMKDSGAHVFVRAIDARP